MTTTFSLRDNRPWLSLRQRPLRRSQITSLGFTLVELLVVIAIIGVLVALLLPAVQAARESSRRTACQNQLRQVGLGIQNYLSSTGRYPPGKKWALPHDDPKSTSYSWAVFILPHLEQGNISTQIDLKQRLTAPDNLPVTSQIIPVYLCPSTARIEPHRTEEGRLFNLGGPANGDGLGCIDYLGISGPEKNATNASNGQEYGPQRGVLIGTKGLKDEAILLEPPPLTPADITDGTSQTLCVVECTGRGADVKGSGEVDELNGAWAAGSNISHIDKTVNAKKPETSWEDERIFSDHPGGAEALACDGSVHFLTEDLSANVIEQLCSRNGEEVINDLPF